MLVPGYAKESTAAVLVAVSLYVFPASLPECDHNGKYEPIETVVTWSKTVSKIPFSVILLVGGGTAAAYGAEASGFAVKLSSFLDDLCSMLNLSDYQTMAVLVSFVVFVTEVMSNTACVSLMLPVFRFLAERRNVNPVLYMYPTTVAASFCFMFPVATPANAEVFHEGQVRLKDMVSYSLVIFFLNIFSSFL